MPGQCVISREIVVAEGVFAPGHLGELTQIVPFEMVDAVLAGCGATQRRLRKLPARVVVYLLLAAALFEECGYLAVWSRLTAGLGSLPLPTVTAAGVVACPHPVGSGPDAGTVRPAARAGDRDRHRRGPLGRPAGGGDRRHLPGRSRRPGHPDAAGKGANQYTAASGYPQILLVALVACGTRAILDAVFGPRGGGETGHGQRLARSLRPGMIVLLDRGLSGNDFLGLIAGTGAAFLARLSAARKPPVLRRFPDGSFLSQAGTLPVRIIECQITIATTAGRHTGVYRLATTLLDSRRPPAFELVKLYHERWEVESAYFALKKTMLGRRVLRSRTLPGIAQEIYALLALYQVIRIAIADATTAVPGTDPDRASFSVALQAARDQVIQAAGVIAGTVVDLVGAIGRAVLNQPMPARRLRAGPRAVKRPLSRHAYKSLRVDRRTYKATISVDILTAQPGP